MKNKALILFFIFMVCMPFISVSQNLVPNPGFEEIDKNGNPKFWLQPESNYNHYRPKTSIGAVNGICYRYHYPTEYFIVRLLKPLKQGQPYCFSCKALRTCYQPAVEIWFTNKTFNVLYPFNISATPVLTLPFRQANLSLERLNGEFIAPEESNYLVIGRFNEKDEKETSKEYERALKVFHKEEALKKQEVEKEVMLDFKNSGFVPADEYEKTMYLREIRKQKYMYWDSIFFNRLDSMKMQYGRLEQKYIQVVYFDYFCLKEVDSDSCSCPKATPAVPKINKPEPYRLEGVRFAIDSDTLKPESYPTLDSLADYLKKQPGIRILISGHTDSTGNEPHNLDLSSRRAKSVRTYLISKGILPGRMRSEGKGSSVPVSTNSTIAGRKWNRRVEFVIEE